MGEVLVVAIFLLIAALFGWWGSSLSNNRGRGRAVGFIVGGLFGLLGIVIVAIIPANKEAQWDRQREHEEARERHLRRRDQR